MSHHGHLGALILVSAIAFVGVIHYRADDSRANLTSDAVMAKKFIGCAGLETEKELIRVANGQTSHELAVFAAPRIDMGVCHMFDSGDRISVDRREPMTRFGQGSENTLGNWYCVRPYNNAECFWMPALFVFGRPL